MQILEELEMSARSSNAPVALRAVHECRVALQKQISKMDNLESTFDKIAERSCEFSLIHNISQLC